jgi:hypothetical protein
MRRGSALAVVLVLVVSCALLVPTTAGAAPPAGFVRSNGVHATAMDGAEFVGGLYDNFWFSGWSIATGTEYPRTFETNDPLMPLYSGIGPGRRDEDFVRFSAVAGHTYEIMADATGPDATVTNPVLWLYNDPAVDPGGEVWAACDDRRLAPPGDINPTIIYTALETKTTYVSVEDYWESAFNGSGNPTGLPYSLLVVDRGIVAAPNMHRPTAPDRYELAAQLAKESLGGSYAGVRHVIIASGLDRAAADPLASAGLAGVYNAPLLLARGDWPSRLPGPTVVAIQQMQAANPGVHLAFHIVGGPASVPDSLKTQIRRYAPGAAIDRLGGADRYQVAANVAARMRSVVGPGYMRSCIVVNGRDASAFWDAMMAGPIAFGQKFPILLTTKNSIPAATAAAAAHYDVKFCIGMGGELYNNVVTSFGPGGQRIGWVGAPSDRQILSRIVAETAEERGWLGSLGAVRQIAVTNKLADALAGGVFMGFKNGPLLFSYDSTQVRNPTWPESDRHIGAFNYIEEFCRIRRMDADDIWLLGGTASVSPDIEHAVGEYFGVTP